MSPALYSLDKVNEYRNTTWSETVRLQEGGSYFLITLQLLSNETLQLNKFSLVYVHVINKRSYKFCIEHSGE